jgi:pyruvate dehydrogenase E1 component
MPDRDGVEEGIVKGAYCWQPRTTEGEEVDILASGAMMQQAVAAAEQLRALGYAPAIWSVTSYVELAREAEACEREARLRPLGERRRPYVERLFADTRGPVVAVSDYVKSLPGSIARWMPEHYTVLGTDGFGLSESREDLRNHFEVSADHIVGAVVVQLYRGGMISDREMREQLEPLGIDPDKPAPLAR